MIRTFYIFVFRILIEWFWRIPTNLGFLALLGYLGIIKLLFGTIDIDVAESVLQEIHLPPSLLLIIGIPMLVSFGASFVYEDIDSTPVSTSTLDKAIAYRDGQVRIKNDVTGFEIYLKTALLDVLKSNSGNKTFDKALRGFNAKYSTSSPSKVYRDLTKD